MESISNFQKWDRRFIELAKHIASWSKDPSTQVGCIIVGKNREIRSTGYNGFPRDIADDERLHDRSQKYPIIVHAEENAIAHAARIGVRLKDCTAYTWPLPPCSKCARLLIQSGISEVVWIEQSVPERWQEDVDRAKSLFKEAGVMMRSVAVANENDL